MQAVNATGTGSLVRTGLSLATAAPWAGGGAPPPAALTVAAPVAPTAEHGVLILRVSGDAYRGDACFTLSIDGQQIGDTLTAGAVHGGQQSQSFTIAGQFAPGAHVVGISLVNDLSGAAGQDRNLYVDGVGFNGVDLHETATLTANGSTMLVTAPVSRSTPVTVNLSEDAWKGDAQAFISIDGQVQGSVVTATASHAAGATQAMSFLVDLAPGAHTVAVTYLNDANGSDSGVGQNRNLYIDSMDIAGAHYPAAAAALTTNGTSTFAFTQDPPSAANSGLFLTVGLAQPASMLVPLG
ncbi:MAG: carbohydrate-binding domain-containing protein [Janthinobacterium lividum]